MSERPEAPLVVQLAPLRVEMDGCTVTILEVVKSRVLDTTFYHVVLKLCCGSVETRPFTIDVRSTRELRAKLLVEISKLKALILLYGEEYARRVVS